MSQTGDLGDRSLTQSVEITLCPFLDRATYGLIHANPSFPIFGPYMNFDRSKDLACYIGDHDIDDPQWPYH